MDYLRARRVCCASDSLGIPGMLAWRILGVPCPPFRWLPLPPCLYCCRLAPSLLGIFEYACLACPWPSSVRFLSALRALSWWTLSSSLPIKLFSPLAWGAAFVMLLFLVPPKFTIHLSIPFWCACLARLWRPLFFEVACLLALLWRTCFTSDCLTGCVGRTFYQTPPSSLRRSAVASPVVARSRRRRRDLKKI